MRAGVRNTEKALTEVSRRRQKHVQRQEIEQVSLKNSRNSVEWWWRTELLKGFKQFSFPDVAVWRVPVRRLWLKCMRGNGDSDRGSGIEVAEVKTE